MRPSASKLAIFLAFGAAVVAIPAWVMRGFTVDDAFIPARYAVHVARGLGHAFSPGGPPTDGVTPLPWTYVLAAFRPGDVLSAFEIARGVSLVCAIAGGLALAHRLASRGPAGLVALLTLASAPVGAWAGCGLETGLAFFVAALAVTSGPRLAFTSAGVLAALRPECLPLAAVLVVARAREPDGAPRWAALAAVPVLGVVAARWWLHGAILPLSFHAKPTTASQGFGYALVGLVLSGGTWLSIGGPRRTLALALPVHLAAVTWAGGDWMPLSRLLVPLLPVLAVLGADALSAGRRVTNVVRVALALGAMSYAWVVGGALARDVLSSRLELVRAAGGRFASTDVVAALDVGWLGAATEARLVDLAGLTDPGIARLPGGHTSKRVTGAMLADRGVTHLVLLRRAGASRREDGGPFSRAVEEVVAHEPWVEEHARLSGTVSGGPLEYQVIRVAP